jgi:hypothetical protein
MEIWNQSTCELSIPITEIFFCYMNIPVYHLVFCKAFIFWPQKWKIRTHDMRYTNIDPSNLTHDHALHHRWWSTPKRQRFEPAIMHYTTIDPPKDQDHALYTTIDNLHDIHGYWWRHCTHKPKALVWWDNVPFSQDSAWKHLNNSSKRPNFHLRTELSL